MADPARKLATYDDLLAVPDTKIAQILDGELIVQPRPAGPHAAVTSSLGGELFNPFQRGRGGPGGWIVLDEPELHLGGDILVPDLAGWRRTRMPEVPAAPFFTLAPDWACEVLSPGTARVDRSRKLPIYAREKIPYAWLIDADARTLEVLKLEQGRWTILGVYAPEGEGGTPIRAEPFDAIELDLACLWADVATPV